MVVLDAVSNADMWVAGEVEPIGVVDVHVASRVMMTCALPPLVELIC